MKLSLKQAEQIAANYQSLRGRAFLHPLFGKCIIDFVEPFEQKNGTYTVVLKTDIYKPPNIPEFFGYRMPMYDLCLYLKTHGIPFKHKNHGLLTDDL